MKKIILAAVSTFAMASLFACSADVPAEVDPQDEGPTGSAIKYDANSVSKTKVEVKSSSSKATSSSSKATSSSSNTDLIEAFAEICDNSVSTDLSDLSDDELDYLGVSSSDLDGSGTYYYCYDDEKVYCDDGEDFTTDCNSELVNALLDYEILP